MTHAIGGNASIIGNYRVHIFTGGYSALTVDESGPIEYLVVGGGGAGGADHGGGGGGGQVITGSSVFSEGAYDVYVGQGGLLGTGRGDFGTNGESSYLGNLIAIGGGRGGQYDNVSGNTGSSGGGGASYSSGGVGGLPLVSGTTGQRGSNGNNSGAGGGGGASTPGQQSEGGNGIVSDLTGVSLMYGSGGGGANRADGAGGSGAGNGNLFTGSATSGLPNRGGGGGGNTSQLSGTFGGSGIVAVRYLFTTTGRNQIQADDINLQCYPLRHYSNTKTNIESLTGTMGGETAFANDNPTAPFGVYTSGGWHWYSTGGVGGASDHNSLTGLQGGTGSQYYHLGYNEWGGLVTGSLTYLHKHSAIDIVTGPMATARLGSGTANASTFLSGDQTYKAPLVFETNANNIFRCDSPGGDSRFVGTIATLPGGATLTYNVTSGNEGAMVPASTSQLGKMRLYNSTRGTSALILDCVTGTNTITLTANVPGDWQVADTITITSTTVDGSASSTYYVDIEIISDITGKSGLFVNMGIVGSAAGQSFRLHPLSTFALSKQVNLFSHTATTQSTRLGMIAPVSNVFSVAWSGTPSVVQISEAGYIP